MTKPATVGAIAQSTNLNDCLLLAHCLKAIPYETVDRALCSVDRTKRRLGKFPDHLVVFHAIFMALFMDASYLHIFEKLQETFAWLSGLRIQIESLSDAAIVQARKRLGSGPLRALFELVAVPLGVQNTAGVFFHGMRLMVIDGTTFDLPDSASNACFGRAINKSGGGAFPMARVVALIESATRLVVDLECGPYVGSSEVSLAKLVLARLKPGMLVLADRNFPGTDLCRLVISTGGHFVWRVKSSLKLKPTQKFEDGSYLANLSQTGENPLTVRVIEYELRGGTEKYRLVTSLLKPEEVGAQELAELYPHRWTEETFFSEIKQVLRAPKVVLRSKSSDMVYQEIYGFFLAHYVVRSFMFEAAQSAGIPPERLSFKHSVHVLKTNLPNFGNFSP